MAVKIGCYDKTLSTWSLQSCYKVHKDVHSAAWRFWHNLLKKGKDMPDLWLEHVAQLHWLQWSLQMQVGILTLKLLQQNFWLFSWYGWEYLEKLWNLCPWKLSSRRMILPWAGAWTSWSSEIPARPIILWWYDYFFLKDNKQILKIIIWCII